MGIKIKMLFSNKLGGYILNKIGYYAQLVLMLSLFWIALFEKVNFLMLGLAPFTSLAAIFISERYLLNDTYYNLFRFNLLKIIRFSFFLLLEIFKSGMSIIPTIITGRSNPTFVEIYTELENNLDLIVLSNSITLTPGTITVDLEGHRLIVLWMNPKTENSSLAGAMIKGELEKRIKEGL